jgi:hypothetical protein
VASFECRKIGFFDRKSDSRKIQRYECKRCRKRFSKATFDPCFGQKRRRLNYPLFRLLCSGVSQRRAAILLNTTRNTVHRKFRFLAIQARHWHFDSIQDFKTNPSLFVQFDDMETSEHSKLKPLSIPLAVDSEGRKILAFDVAVMPAKGHLARKSLQKYGYRPDERPQALERMFRSLESCVHPKALFLSDQNPLYARRVEKFFPEAEHEQVKSRRGCVVGQGELKKIGWDPLFSLNHTAAMLRANINRLFRRTWCTTKKRERLLDHLYLYAAFHNLELTK